MLERLSKALIAGDGKIIADTSQAHQAIIGRPDDASWNDPARFTLFDEDEPGKHKTLIAQTRLGEDSVIAIPLWFDDEFDAIVTPDFAKSKAWFLKAVSLSRKGVVNKLKRLGVPVGWKKSSLLRNCFPLLLDKDGRWVDDTAVRVDDDLGLVYETKDTE